MNDVFLYPPISASLSPHQISVSLLSMVIGTEAHIWSGCRGPATMGCSSLHGTTVSQLHLPRLRSGGRGHRRADELEAVGGYKEGNFT